MYLCQWFVSVILLVCVGDIVVGDGDIVVMLLVCIGDAGWVVCMCCCCGIFVSVYHC